MTTTESLRSPKFRCPRCGRDVALDVMVGEVPKCFSCSGTGDRELVKRLLSDQIGQPVHETREAIVLGVDPFGRYPAAAPAAVLAAQGIVQTVTKAERPDPEVRECPEPVEAPQPDDGGPPVYVSKRPKRVDPVERKPRNGSLAAPFIPSGPGLGQPIQSSLKAPR